jgi:hypothetical protein
VTSFSAEFADRYPETARLLDGESRDLMTPQFRDQLVAAAKAQADSPENVEALLAQATPETLLTTFKVLTHRVHEYDTGLARDPQRADLYRRQREQVEGELLRRLSAAQPTTGA